MSRFPHHFRAHVLPRLLNLLAAQAACIAAGVESFSGGYDAVLHYAMRYGALCLPEGKFEELEDWIATALLVEIDRVEGLGG